MKKVQEFRTRAAECRVMSVKGPTPEIREHYRNLAYMWDRLAEQRLALFISKDAGEAV